MTLTTSVPVSDIDSDNNGATELLERVETAIAFPEVSPRTEINYAAVRNRPKAPLLS